jgi:hypothetical protein
MVEKEYFYGDIDRKAWSTVLYKVTVGSSGG